MLAPASRAAVAAVAASLMAGVSMTAAIATPPSHRDSAAAAASSPAGDPARTGDPATPAATTVDQVGGDLRSSGRGGSLAGSPLLAIGTVLAIGAGSAVATLAGVRLTAGRGGRPWPSAPRDPGRAAPGTGTPRFATRVG